MKKTLIVAKDCPKAIGPYSIGVKSGNMIFANQIGLTKDEVLVSEDPGEQMKQCLKNIKNIVEAGGGEMDDIVKCTISLTDLNDFSAVNAVYATFFTEPYPSRACIQVAGIPGNGKVLVEAIAMV